MPSLMVDIVGLANLDMAQGWVQCVMAIPFLAGLTLSGKHNCSSTDIFCRKPFNINNMCDNKNSLSMYADNVLILYLT